MRKTEREGEKGEGGGKWKMGETEGERRRRVAVQRELEDHYFGGKRTRSCSVMKVVVANTVRDYSKCFLWFELSNI